MCYARVLVLVYFSSMASTMQFLFSSADSLKARLGVQPALHLIQQ